MKTTKTSLIIIAFIFLGILDANCQTIATNNAFGDNQVQVEPGVFAIYSGDINQDGFISTEDISDDEAVKRATRKPFQALSAALPIGVPSAARAPSRRLSASRLM